MVKPCHFGCPLDITAAKLLECSCDRWTVHVITPFAVAAQQLHADVGGIPLRIAVRIRFAFAFGVAVFVHNCINIMVVTFRVTVSAFAAAVLILAGGSVTAFFIYLPFSELALSDDTAARAVCKHIVAAFHCVVYAIVFTALFHCLVA